MKYEYKFFIGANNDTGLVELPKIISMFSSNTKAYTVHDTIGFWKGSKESSVLVTVIAGINDRYQMQLIKKQLEKVLNQESVLLTAHIIECL